MSNGTAMDTAPIISVVVPCYNQGHFLSAALRSVLSQSYKAIEIIVVDDGSIDDTEQVARSFGAAIRYVYRPNAGPSSARNRGVEESTGSYIAFLDADDWWDPRFLQTLLDALLRMGGRGLAYCRQALVDASGVRLARPPINAAVGADPFRALLAGTMITADAILVDAPSLRAAGGFDEGLRGHEDWDLWLRLARHGVPFVFVPRTLAFYRQHGQGAHYDHTLMDASRLAVLQRFAADCRTPPYIGVYQEAAARAIAAEAVHMVQRGDLDSGLARFRQAVSLAPRALSGSPYLIVFLLEALRAAGAGAGHDGTPKHALGAAVHALPPTLTPADRNGLVGLLYAGWVLAEIRRGGWRVALRRLPLVARVAPGLLGDRLLRAWVWRAAFGRLAAKIVR